MKKFKITNEVTIECWTKQTRAGFRHFAKLFINGRPEEQTSIFYSNRTWERFEYESVLVKLVKSAIGGSLKTECLAFIEKFEDNSMLGTIAMAAKMGEVLAGEKKEDKNAWKLRMLKAGFAGFGEGLLLPDNWDELSEEEKERRLNGAIGELEK